MSDACAGSRSGKRVTNAGRECLECEANEDERHAPPPHVPALRLPSCLLVGLSKTSPGITGASGLHAWFNSYCRARFMLRLPRSWP